MWTVVVLDLHDLVAGTKGPAEDRGTFRRLCWVRGARDGGLRHEVADGSLMFYGPEMAESYRRAAALADRILKGARPADLPVEDPTRFTLAVNMNTAKALGITLPQVILARADEVVE